MIMRTPRFAAVPGFRQRLLLKLYLIGGFLFLLGVSARWAGVELLGEAHFLEALSRKGVIPTAEISAAFLETARSGLFLSHVVSLATALAVATLLVKVVITRLHQVILITRRVAAGDFTATVPAGWKDEIDELGQAFNAMTDSLRRMEELRAKLVLDISHDIRAPLMNMRGYLDAIHAGAVAPSRETIDSLREEAIRVATLADQLTRLSAADAASVNIQKGSTDLAGLIVATLDLLKRAFEEKQITVETEALANVPVPADAEKLKQIVFNLLDNACRYTPEQGRVALRLDVAGDKIRATFTSSGEPIAEDDLRRLFERFRRSSRSLPDGGAGIGLAIVRELVEAHGGRVGAESLPAGNRFWFELPLQP